MTKKLRSYMENSLDKTKQSTKEKTYEACKNSTKI